MGTSSARSRSGGTSDREDVEPVVEILPECPVGHRVVEILVGRRDHADVDGDRMIAADAFDLTLLQDSQQCSLGFSRKIADLVQEERAAVGGLEAAEPPLQRSCKRALLVTE